MEPATPNPLDVVGDPIVEAPHRDVPAQRQPPPATSAWDKALLEALIDDRVRIADERLARGFAQIRQLLALPSPASRNVYDAHPSRGHAPDAERPIISGTRSGESRPAAYDTALRAAFDRWERTGSAAAARDYARLRLRGLASISDQHLYAP